MPQYEFSPSTSRHLLEQHGPIVGNFQVTTVPAGEAPRVIKKAWLHEGMVLPVREKALPGFPYWIGRSSLQLALEDYQDGSVAVSGGDAILALKNAGEQEAVNYWVKHLGKNALVSPFFFHPNEGTLTPVEAPTVISDLKELVDDPALLAELKAAEHRSQTSGTMHY
jgi:hypothetical protein